jgi:hypothetical protein
MYKIKSFGSFLSNNGIEYQLMTSTQYNPLRILEKLKCRKLERKIYGNKKKLERYDNLHEHNNGKLMKFSLPINCL